MNYSQTFYENIFLRHSCGNCHFTNLKRPSDITLADFWHSENIDPDFNKDNKGASLVLVNTAKGAELFEAIKDRTNYISVDIEKCKQKQMSQPSVIHPKRVQFEYYYARYGFVKTMKRFGYIDGFWHTYYVVVRKLKKILQL